MFLCSYEGGKQLLYSQAKVVVVDVLHHLQAGHVYCFSFGCWMYYRAIVSYHGLPCLHHPHMFLRWWLTCLQSTKAAKGALIRLPHEHVFLLLPCQHSKLFEYSLSHLLQEDAEQSRADNEVFDHTWVPGRPLDESDVEAQPQHMQHDIQGPLSER